MGSGAFVYRDARMAEIAAQAGAAADGAANILIEGAPGTGRGTLARHIHACAGHDAEALMPVHCAASTPKCWLREIAAGAESAMLLVDVCELSLPAQAELALALGKGGQDGARVIATASRPLGKAVREGAFREDLFYRLGVIRFQLPELRKRPDDIPALAAHFASRFADAHARPCRTLSDEVLDRLYAYAWPGNVQELENVIHRAVLFAETEVITAADISLPDPEPVQQPDAVSAGLVGRTVADVERELILHTLRHCCGNRTQAADILGISVRTLRNKIRQYLEEGANVPAFSRAA
jgi:DNA-binding NtrC family response regulator